MGGSRMEKLNQQFRREIGSMLVAGDVSDPRLAFVSITWVDISKDLSYAHVGFSVLGDDPAAVRHATAALASARGRVRRLLGERVSIRHIPEVRFVYDDTIAESVRMGRTLDDLKKEREDRERREGSGNPN